MTSAHSVETTSGIDAALAQETLCAAFQATAAANADRVALRIFHADDVAITWREYAARVRSVATGLAALGVGPGETVGLMMGNRPEFHYVDTAAMHLGAIPFSIYHTNPPEQVRPLVENSGARVIVCEPERLATVSAVAAEMPQVEHVIVAGGPAGRGQRTLAQLEALDAPGFDFEASWRSVPGDAIGTIVYTSGTTGDPKGVEWSHGALMSVLRVVHAQAPVSSHGRWVAYLPMAHLAERFCGHYGQISFGYDLTCVADHREVAAAMAHVHPTRFFGVPRIYEKLVAHARALAAEDPEQDAALAVSLASVQAEREGTADAASRASGEQARRALAPLRARLGLDAVEYLQSSAAPARIDVLELFWALGLQIVETWGMSETATVLANPPDDTRIGTVGVTMPGCEVRIADDGELLVRGPLFTRYRSDPERTREALDAHGWMHTGDIAQEAGEGYYRIVDRKKEIIINSAGKNIAPTMVENRIKQHSPLIGAAVAIGDGRRYVTALVVLDEEALQRFAARNGLSGTFAELARSAPVRAEIARAVERANATLARVEQVKEHCILEVPWAPGGEELTTTMKLRRRVIATRYAAEIEALYA